jgi:hypothetical protein
MPVMAGKNFFYCHSQHKEFQMNWTILLIVHVFATGGNVWHQIAFIAKPAPLLDHDVFRFQLKNYLFLIQKNRNHPLLDFLFSNFSKF